MAGEWFVVNGGISRGDSHSWGIVNQRYAYDLVIAGENNARYRSDGSAVDSILEY